ncbi:MAG: adenylate/guanylate cyclase domain-containing protein [Planctomycetales bacterium]|nr:adenylate/guanylate cyclase domain-containing protein [Planctomycetales bacterium]
MVDPLNNVMNATTGRPPMRCWRWWHRHALVLVGLAPLGAQIIGSAFNIWYNGTHVKPVLSEAQFAAFRHTVIVYNAIAYPVAVTLWIVLLSRLVGPYRRLCRGETIDAGLLMRTRRRIVNLPWGLVVIAGVTWLMCIPAFLYGLTRPSEPLDPRVAYHLTVSFVIAGSIGVTHGFFAVELVSQRWIYPLLFQDAHPAETPGAISLTLTGRGLLWAFSSCVCPICALLLIRIVARSPGETLLSEMTVGVVGILFGLTTAWMLGQLVTRPVYALHKAAKSVAAGNLDTHVGLLHADEFGPLIAEFNRMVADMREKQYLQEMFGRHVGTEAARRILARDPGLGGSEDCVTVMFADLRDFTARSSDEPADEVVATLNVFLSEMVDVIERRGGMVNKFLGDGLMALFGVGEDDHQHADAALGAALEMVAQLECVNRRLGPSSHGNLRMGVGIHTGMAIVGSIGSPQRLEYTAIGDTVNIASRIEGLTKVVGRCVLISQATRDALSADVPLDELPAQMIKGKSSAVTVYAPRAVRSDAE